ncbi:hypothetical protein ARMSODRAFT_414730 [Armillaria solidipes]|uniref:F-box domain-containing protein n=1 Tax=Armillaria solidipes TaxID=1076256 RepID=A0A2H3BYJ5_9AGAR|nr:hypothetical protein ARMSODRAFT_414730 [Armillaria solidipes]
MVELLELPQETLSLIASEVHDNASLLSASLAGSHILSAIIRPLLWRHVYIACNVSLGPEDDLQAARITALCADLRRVSAARALNIKLRGHFDYSLGIFRSLAAGLPNFTNVTHASIDCCESHEVISCGQPGYFVRRVLISIPSLVSLTVKGCYADDADFGNFSDDEDASSDDEESFPVIAPQLRHLYLKYCGCRMARVWYNIPRLEVLEMEAGDGRAWYAKEMKGGGKWGGIESRILDVTGPMELEHAQHLMRLMLRSSAGTDSVVLDENIFGGTDGHLEHIRMGIWNDLENTVYFFETNALHNLTELVLDLKYNPELFGKLLASAGIASCPLRRLYIGTSKPWDRREDFETAFPRAGNDRGRSPVSFRSFSALQELYLPCDGISFGQLDVLPLLLEELPRLNHLYLGHSGDKDQPHRRFEDAARAYSSIIRTAHTISWTGKRTIEVERYSDYSVRCLKAREYRSPRWIHSCGIGEWWETGMIKGNQLPGV